MGLLTLALTPVLAGLLALGVAGCVASVPALARQFSSSGRLASRLGRFAGLYLLFLVSLGAALVSAVSLVELWARLSEAASVARLLSLVALAGGPVGLVALALKRPSLTLVDGG